MAQETQSQGKKEDPALVFGILSLVFGTVLPIGVLAVIMGVIGIVKSKVENTTGRVLSIIGTVWGAVATILQVIAIVVLVVVFGGMIGWLFDRDFDFSWGDGDYYVAACEYEDVEDDYIETCVGEIGLNIIRGMIDGYVARNGDRVVGNGSTGGVDLDSSLIDDRFLSEDVSRNAIINGELTSYAYFYTENGVGVKEMARVLYDWRRLLGHGSIYIYEGVADDGVTMVGFSCDEKAEYSCITYRFGRVDYAYDRATGRRYEGLDSQCVTNFCIEDFISFVDSL
jgi:hypothetical protein